MAKDLIHAIKSLNTKSFSDYQHLIFDLKEVITDYEAHSRKRLLKERNMDEYDFRGNSIDYIIEVYNNKLEEFVTNFFWGQELIRSEASSNPRVLKEINFDYINYLWPIAPHSEPFDRPSSVDIASVRSSNFKTKYESNYFIKPKAIEKKDGCFIATFAFESYDHSNVKMLRSYRDDHLKPNYFGRKLIKFYYRFSPSLVKLFEKINFPKNIIRKALKIYISILRFLFQKDF